MVFCFWNKKYRIDFSRGYGYFSAEKFLVLAPSSLPSPSGKTILYFLQKRKKHKSLNNPLKTCVNKVTYDYRIATVNININQDVLCTDIEHGADCLEIYVLFTKML